MEIKKIKLGNKEVMPFTIPSGIITTEVSAICRLARNIAELGIITTKSIGLEPRAGNREPIIAEYAPYSFVNAVGLTNPGADEFAKRLDAANFPTDKFLLVSIFGKDPDEFRAVAHRLEKHADGFELNLSCPHAKNYGMALGQDPEMVGRVVANVRAITKKPIFAKLTPNVPNIADIANAAMQAGAYGITAINTVGPGAHMADGKYILTNKVGGMSGIGITPIGVKCVKDITDKLGNIPIIACGGIFTPDDIKSYSAAGATIFGIGSALAGMTDSKIAEFFSSTADCLINGKSHYLSNPRYNMQYKKLKVSDMAHLGDGMHVLRTNAFMSCDPGEFMFAWLPGKGEKPFSIMADDPLTIGFQERGCFTKELAGLKEGDEIYFRGPYGNLDEINNKRSSKQFVLVGGGSGIAGIYSFAKAERYMNIAGIFIGAKTLSHIGLADMMVKPNRDYNIYISTDDGSLGEKGFVPDLMERHIREIASSNNLEMEFEREKIAFINCGPEQMVRKVIEIEKRFANPEDIYSSVEYMTKCGIGICGSCADKQGRRTCVEGPFMKDK